ncbi:MAG: carbohydrate-binding protein, partial [Bacteroidota bacterium]
LSFEGNQSFYFSKQSRKYEVKIDDPEDEGSGGIKRTNASVSFVFVEDGEDLEVVLGKEKGPINGSFRFLKGYNLIQNSDCWSCHNLKQKSIGPSYEMVSEKYQNDPEALEYLANKIITGGNGVWGEKIMAGHPQHSLEETREMARYILSLADESNQGRMPFTGQLVTNQHQPENVQGAYLFSASYTDGGGNGLPASSRREVKILRAPRLKAIERTGGQGFGERMDGPDRDNPILTRLGNGAKIFFAPMDFTDIRKAVLRVKSVAGGSLQLWQKGQQIGSLNVKGEGSNAEWKEIVVPVSPRSGRDLFQIKVSGGDGWLFDLDWIEWRVE